MDRYLSILATTWRPFDSSSVVALLFNPLALFPYSKCSSANFSSVKNSSWLWEAGCVDCLVVRVIVCELQSDGLVLCCGFLLRTSKTRWFVCFLHGDAPTCQVIRYDCAELEFDCLAFGEPIAHLCLFKSFWVEYSSAQRVSFLNGSRPFPIKQAFFDSAPLFPIPPSSQTSKKTEPPTRTASLRSFSAPSLWDP